MENYQRPGNALSRMSKVYERIMFTQSFKEDKSSELLTEFKTKSYHMKNGKTFI